LRYDLLFKESFKFGITVFFKDVSNCKHLCYIYVENNILLNYNCEKDGVIKEILNNIRNGIKLYEFSLFF
jgi:hypothetical protein